MTPRARLAVVAAALCGLAACGPVPVAQAERNCLERARDASGPRGEISMGVGSDGRHVRPVTGIALSISSDAIMGRDPADVFNSCVVQQSGQMPMRPLYQQPGWKG